MHAMFSASLVPLLPSAHMHSEVTVVGFVCLFVVCFSVLKVACSKFTNDTAYLAHNKDWIFSETAPLQSQSLFRYLPPILCTPFEIIL